MFFLTGVTEMQYQKQQQLRLLDLEIGSLLLWSAIRMSSRYLHNHKQTIKSVLTYYLHQLLSQKLLVDLYSMQLRVFHVLSQAHLCQNQVLLTTNDLPSSVLSLASSGNGKPNSESDLDVDPEFNKCSNSYNTRCCRL